MEKPIYFLWGFIIFINLLFKSGWDTWTQTLSFYLSLIFIILILWSGPALKLKYTGFLVLTFLFTLISYFFAARTGTGDIAFISWINCIFFFYLGSGYLSKVKEKTARSIASICVWAGVLDLAFPILIETSLFPNPNIKAGFFLLTIPFLLHILKEAGKKKKGELFIWIPGLTVTLFSFLQASSRWGSIVLVLSITAWLFTNNMKKLAAAAAGSGVIAGIIFFNFQSLAISFIPRLGWLEAGVRMILRRPFTGFGPGSTPHILPSFRSGELTRAVAENIQAPSIPEASRFTQYIHSYFIQFGAEFGLPAIFFFIIFLFLSLKSIFTHPDKLVKTAGVALLFLAVYNLLEYNLSIPLVGFIFFSILGTFLPADTIKIKITGTVRKVGAAIAASLLIAGGSIFAARPFRSGRYFGLGMNELAISNTRKAYGYFEKYFKLYPSSYLAPIGEALIEIKEGNLLRAEDLIMRSIPLPEEPNPAVEALKEGEQALREGDLTEAEKKYLESISIRFKQFGYRFSALKNP